MSEIEVKPRPGTGPVALVAVALGATAAALLLGLRAEQVWREGVGTIDRAVEIAVEAGACACAAWIALGAVVGLAYAAVRRAGREWHAGRAFLARCAPAAVRRLAGVIVTAGVGIGLTAPGAFAAPTPAPPEDRAGAPPVAVVVDLGWQPTTGGGPEGRVGDGLSSTPAELIGIGAGRTIAADGDGTPAPGRTGDPERTRQADRHAREGGPRDDAEQRGPREDDRSGGGGARDDRSGGEGARDGGSRSVPGRVVVGEGDSLWSIAAAHLASGGDGARSAPPRPGRVARETVAWYAANRDAIGPDPDLIRPGTVLHAPAARTQGARP